MKVGIDGTCWSNPRGYGRYARGLITALLKVSSEHEFELFVDAQTREAWALPDGANIISINTQEAPSAAASANGRRSFADMLVMGRAVRRVPLDVFFFPSVFTYFPIWPGPTIILGIHDVIVENHRSLVFPERKQRLLWWLKSGLARKQADFILTVSDFAKEGIEQRFGWPSDKVWVVGEAPDSIFQPITDESLLEALLSRYGLERSSPYIVCLGGLNPHKNLDSLIRVMADLASNEAGLNVRLLLIGPAEDDSFTPGASSIRRLVDGLGLGGKVHLTGFLPDEEVASLLTAASAFVMPSFEEGFGLGAVEAAACGTPVIATRNSPLPKLLEGGGLFIDPHRPDELKHALVTLLTDEGLRQDMAKHAKGRADLLTWKAAASQFLALLKAVADKKV